jgi:hypothetical protein
MAKALSNIEGELKMGFQPERTCDKCRACGICGGKKNAKFCRKFVPIPPPPPPKATSSVQQKKERTKIFLEMNLETVPSEMTARVLLKLIENYCNHFNKYIAMRYNEDGTKTLEIRPKEN